MTVPFLASPRSQSHDLGRRIFHEHIRPYGRYFGVALVLMVLAALSTSALPYLLEPVFDKVFTNGTPRLLMWVCGGIFLAFVVKGATSFGEAVIMTYVGQRIISDLQNRLFSHLMHLDLAFFHGTSSGDLLSRFTNDINLMRNAVATTLVGIGKDSFTLAFLVALMFYRDWTLACIAFFIFPLAVFPILRIGRRMRKVTNNTQEELGSFTGRLTQVFQGIRVIKAYRAEDYEAKRAYAMTERIFALVYKSARVRSASHPIIESLGGMAIVIVIAYGGWQVMHHARTTGEFMSFILALLLVYEPLKRLSNMNANLQEGLAAAARVFKILDTAATIQDRPEAKPLPLVKEHIEFQDVRFSYPDGKMALDGINLRIKKAQSIALVGASGAGKSTIINLIPRFYDIQHGAILIDGVDIRDVTLASLRQQIALVSQEITLFDTTIRDNIAYGSFNAPEAEIIAAAKAAAAHEFITVLPNGYDTMIGENGVKLSGGQRQRIAIARAMLKNAPILLLDEATSALDTDSERQVQAALKTLMEGRTTLMVAHRLSTVVEASKIYVLNKGKIVESGDHHTLLGSNGIYASLWQAQSTLPAPEAA
ncbi:MAG: ABC-type multidrug transport system, ATPase and permease component [Alphaproteobacteria bacterium]|nr:ABC-type multidrug transport system, ATPase and permease component [Alphaproteobacteria bacterium]